MPDTQIINTLEAKLAKKDALAELAFMKDLFLNKLPVGDDTEQIEQTILDLEKLIFTKGPDAVLRDFDPLNDPEPDGDSATKREYQYYSAALSKLEGQRQKRLRDDSDLSKSTHQPEPQDLEATTHAEGYLLPVQDGAPST